MSNALTDTRQSTVSLQTTKTGDLVIASSLFIYGKTNLKVEKTMMKMIMHGMMTIRQGQFTTAIETIIPSTDNPAETAP